MQLEAVAINLTTGGAAPSDEKGEPTHNLTSFGSKHYQGVLEVRAHYMVVVYPYSAFPVFVEISIRSNFLLLFSRLPEIR